MINVTRGSKRTLAAVISAGVLVLSGCGAGAPSGGGGTVRALTPSATAILPTPASAATPITQSSSTVGTAQSIASTLAPPSPLHPAGTLTNADAGKTVTFKVGDTIDLALKAANGFDNWEVATPDAAILRPTVNPAAAAVRGATLRAFQAVGVGTTAITATSKPTCLAGQACPQLVQAFKVTVVVGA